MSPGSAASTNAKSAPPAMAKMVPNPNDTGRKVRVARSTGLVGSLICFWERRYDLATEFGEALEHSMDRGKNTKIVLKVSDVGVQY